tara:strand:+ start:1259 stop:2947 length:1689 start_codon:yes stop_codon:yes gene_type:complete
MANLSEKKKKDFRRDKVLKHANQVEPTFPAFIAGLETYSGNWDFQMAAHLLRRTTIGPTIEEINESVEDGLDKTIAKLLDESGSNIQPPINYQDEEDSEVPLGSTWINAERRVNDFKRRNSYSAWRIEQILDKTKSISIRENMVLFWQNHFATEATVVNDARYTYYMHEKFRKNFLGDFKQLVKMVNIDPAMLIYLSGEYNVKDAPNENYARELFELFTIGKGPIDGEGSYTYYTEADIWEASKILTGWRVKRNQRGEERQYFTEDRHDSSLKTFSQKFGKRTISPNGDKEHEDLIDLIFENDRVSEFICEKIYRWFVYYVINDEVSEKIIKPLAKTLRDNNYRIKPVIDQLLRSTHFYEVYIRGAVIKNPISFSLGFLRQFNLSGVEELDVYEKYYFWKARHSNISDQGQSILDHPNVAGWPAYYQEPLYHEYWITSVTLPIRTSHIKYYLSNNGVRASQTDNNVRVKANPLNLIETFDKPEDIVAIVERLCEWLLPVQNEISEELKNDLVNSVVGNNSNIWEDEYTDFINDPDEEKKESLNKKLRSLLKEICLMPEYYLS